MAKWDLWFLWSIAFEICCVFVARVEGCTFLRCFTLPGLQSKRFLKRTISQRCPINFLFCTVNSEARCLVLNVLINGQERNKANEGGDTTVLGRDKTLMPIDLSILVSRAWGRQMSRGPNVNLPAEHAINFLSPKATTKGKESYDGEGEGKDFLKLKEGRDAQLLSAWAGSTGRGCGGRAASRFHEHMLHKYPTQTEDTSSPQYIECFQKTPGKLGSGPKPLLSLPPGKLAQERGSRRSNLYLNQFHWTWEGKDLVGETSWRGGNESRVETSPLRLVACGEPGWAEWRMESKPHPDRFLEP